MPVLDLDMALVSSLLMGGRSALKVARDSGITAELLSGSSAKQVFDFIEAHTREHRELPSEELVVSKFGVRLPEVKDSLPVLVSEIRDRHLWQLQGTFLGDFEKLVNGRTPHEAHAAVEEYQRQVRQAQMVGSKVESLFDYAEGVIQAYLDAKDGKLGIRTYWPTLDDSTRGWWPEDFVVIAARPKTGKTWVLLMMAHQAWKDGASVLVISTEMSRARLLRRFVALELKLPYNDLVRGELDMYEEERFLEETRKLIGQPGLEVIGAGWHYTTVNVEDAIAITKPDLVVIDGMYLIKPSSGGNNSRERLSNVANDLVETAQLHAVPIVGTHQFNREVDPNDLSTGRLENLGGSDVIGWNVSAAFALLQTDDMREDRQMIIRPMALRESGAMDDVVIDWDLSRMSFGELGGEAELEAGEPGAAGQEVPF